VSEHGRINLIGIGPDGSLHITVAAATAIRQADVVIGYRAYIDQIRARLRGKIVLDRAIGQEIERAEEAIEHACQGRRVALVSGGDAGVYGMAGPLFESLRARGWHPGQPPEVQVIPGVTAAQMAAARLGAPLMHDFATISLSDLLTPWDVIIRRVEAAASADFIIALYNPISQRRVTQLPAAFAAIRQHRGRETPVAFVRDAGRPSESVAIASLAEADQQPADMRTVIIVGNSNTERLGDLLITPRGYFPQRHAR
jgi:precorrin-3B C17-methyltransferase